MKPTEKRVYKAAMAWHRRIRHIDQRRMDALDRACAADTAAWKKKTVVQKKAP